MKVIVATSNRDKFNEISSVLKEFGILAEQRDVFIKETAEALEEIVIDKSRQAWSKIRQPLIVDDTGIFFEAYKNFPGPFAKRMYQSLGFDGLFRLLEGKNRDAYFKTIVCYMESDNRYHLFEGIMKGKITDKIHEIKREMLPYERIFIPVGYDIPVSQMSLDEKTKISHRAIAVRKFAGYFSKKEEEASI